MAILANEQPDVIVQILTPGRVETDFGLGLIPRDRPFAVTLKESVAGLVKLIDGATKENSGSFYLWNGELVNW